MSLALLVGCTFPTRSGEFACFETSECDDGRECREGFCVLREDTADAGTVTTDGASNPDAPPPDMFVDPFEAIKPMCMAAGYIEDATTGGFYRRVNNGQQWAQAQADCKNDVPGATHLMVLNTAEEATGTFLNGKGGWIGMSDIATEDMFVTVTGETNTGLFAGGQPDDGGGGEDCIEVVSGRLNDDQCGNGHNYTCECDGKASNP